MYSNFLLYLILKLKCRSRRPLQYYTNLPVCAKSLPRLHRRRCYQWAYGSAYGFY